MSRFIYNLIKKQKLEVKKSILEPSKLVLSLVYQNLDFALKSPRTTIMKGFFSKFDHNLILGFPKIFQDHLCFD